MASLVSCLFVADSLPFHFRTSCCSTTKSSFHFEHTVTVTLEVCVKRCGYKETMGICWVSSYDSAPGVTHWKDILSTLLRPRIYRAPTLRYWAFLLRRYLLCVAEAGTTTGISPQNLSKRDAFADEPFDQRRIGDKSADTAYRTYGFWNRREHRAADCTVYCLITLRTVVCRRTSARFRLHSKISYVLVSVRQLILCSLNSRWNHLCCTLSHLLCTLSAFLANVKVRACDIFTPHYHIHAYIFTLPQDRLWDGSGTLAFTGTRVLICTFSPQTLHPPFAAFSAGASCARVLRHSPLRTCTALRSRWNIFLMPAAFHVRWVLRL